MRGMSRGAAGGGEGCIGMGGRLGGGVWGLWLGVPRVGECVGEDGGGGGRAALWPWRRATAPRPCG